MKNKTLYFSVLFSAFFACQAQTTDLGEPISTTVRLNEQGQNILSQGAISKQIMLMNIKLTEKQKRDLLTFKSTNNITPMVQPTTLPAKKELGMNNVPVLDQGSHGACVTFANTGAIDALLGQGDYVSQLCHLELGKYLEGKSYMYSGWNGSWGTHVLSQIERFGIVNKTKQRAFGCGGLTEYPMASINTGSGMSLDEYKNLSESTIEKLSWISLLTLAERFGWDPNSSKDGDELLLKVKKAIAFKPSYASNVRLTFATILPISHCNVGACARYHATDDTWALTNAIKNDQEASPAGHEMIITGYDDNAVAIDNEGHEHRGLLTLRNSWGSAAGDYGNYYMTYDFFKQFVLEVQAIARIS